MRISKILTLSVYKDGMHRVKGKATKEDKKWGRLSFGESLSPLHFMTQSFKDLPLGTKIKITMEQYD